MTATKSTAAPGKATAVTPCPHNPLLDSVPWKNNIKDTHNDRKKTCAITQCSVEWAVTTWMMSRRHDTDKATVKEFGSGGLWSNSQ
jgi:hypothetical protein